MTTEWIENGQCTSPAARALTAVLRTILGPKRVVSRNEDETSPGNCYRVCSYREDFDYLWNLGRDLEEGRIRIGQECTLIVVWDGMPLQTEASLIQTDQYLTPLDWAVGFSLAAQSQNDKAPSFRILVLDLASDRLTAADSIRYFAQFPPRGAPAMPWIRVFRPVGDAKWEEKSVEDFDLLPVALLADLNKHCLKFFTAVPAAERNSALVMVRRVWAASLSQPAEPGDHHALANLVGPLLLRSTGAGDTRARALHVLLKQVGLVPSTLATCRKCSKKIDRNVDKCPKCEAAQTRDAQPLLADNKPWIDWEQETWKIALRRVFDEDKAALRFLLVDDNAFQTGWAEILRMALGLDARPLPDSPRPGEPLLVGTRNQKEPRLEFYAVESANNWLARVRSFPEFSEREGAMASGDVESGETVVSQKFRFDCGLPKRDGPPVDVLLLDLRLHQGQSLAEEATYFEKLLKCAEQCCENDTRNNAGQGSPNEPAHSQSVRHLPWPGFNRDELGLMKDWVQDARAGKAPREDPRYHRALTLLPRLIALTDCSLPIVLFSSTGRREILELLKPYGNIITAFEKPRLAAIPDPAIAGHTAGQFRDAIEAALALVSGRRLCLQLLSGVDKLSKRSQYADERPRLEIYFDETERNGEFRVGGLVVVYPDVAAAESFASTMQACCVQWGYHRDNPCELDAPPEYLRKEQRSDNRKVREVWATLARAAEQANVDIAVFALGCDDVKGQVPWGKKQDHLFRGLVRDSIELLLFEWIPRFLVDSTPEVAIFVATRMLVRNDQDGLKDTDLLHASRNFGFGLRTFRVSQERPVAQNVMFINGVQDLNVLQSALKSVPNGDKIAYQQGVTVRTPDPVKVDRLLLDTSQMSKAHKTRAKAAGFTGMQEHLEAFSFGFDDAHPILAEALGQRHKDVKWPTIVSAMGVQLVYYRENWLIPHQLPRQIHYAADWVLANPSLTPREWRQDGVWEKRDLHFQHLLNACRSAQSPDGAVKALLDWVQAKHDWNRPIVGWAADRLVSCLPSVSGSDFVRLCARLRDLKMPQASAAQPTAVHPSKIRRLTVGSPVEIEIVRAPGNAAGVFARTATGGFTGLLEWRKVRRKPPKVGESLQAVVTGTDPPQFRLEN